MSHLSPKRLGVSLWHTWKGINQVLFGAWCLRLIAANYADVHQATWSLCVLTGGFFVLGFYRPAGALFAFGLAVPLLNGLVQTGLLPFPTPLTLSFAGLWLGLFAASARHGFKAGNATSPQPLELMANLLVTSVWLSLGLQILRHHPEEIFRNAFFRQAGQSYNSPHYFLTSATVYLQGLYFFLSLCAHGKKLWRWTTPFVLTWIVTLGGFRFIEYRYHIPEGWAYGFQSPFEDISSLGSIAAALFIFALARQCCPLNRKSIAYLLGGAGMLIMLVGSYSRTAWLGAIVGMLVLGWLRLPRRITLGVLGLTGIAVLGINHTADHSFWKRQAYLWRLVTLVRFENLGNKDASRVEFYQRAGRMIAERPWLGHGVGSFYLKSPAYSGETDQYRTTTDFAHNVFLQIGSEQGAVIALLFCGILGCAVWSGIRGAHLPAPTSSPDQITRLAVALSLFTYLLTGVTANSLAIYVSNQFFVWFLAAALLTSAQKPAGTTTIPRSAT